MLAPLLLLTLSARAAGIPVVHGAVQVVAPKEVVVGEQPVLAMAVPDREAVLHVECTVVLPDGTQKLFTETTGVLPVGEPAQVRLDVAPPTAAATCLVVANFANGLSERRQEEVGWTWVEPTPEQPADDQ